jgi:hypothetical protein
MTGPVVEGRSVLPLSPDGLPCVEATLPSPAVSTRGLIVAALLCGLAILAAFALQVTLLAK